MAPNRKTHDLFASHAELASLRATIQPKYLPLTTETGNRSHLVTDPKTEKAPRAVSYWDWSYDTARETKAAEIDDLFSLSRLETNLASDCLRRDAQESSPPTLTPIAKEESQSYWDWSIEDDAHTQSETDTQEAAEQPVSQQARPERADYWTWRGDADTNHDASAPSNYLHNLVANSRKKYHRRHSHLHPETESASDRYWHWSEYQGTVQ